MTDPRHSWIRSPFVGVVLGFFAGGLVVLLFERLGHLVVGTGDLTNPASITGPMFASVLIAWVLGTGAAGAVATYWARAKSLIPAAIAGLVLLAGAITNILAFPHPVWMIVGAIVLMPAAAILAGRGVARRGLAS